MPQLGEIKSAKAVKKIGTARYIWHACRDCGYQRWVQLAKGKPDAELCKRCCKRGPRSKQWKGGKRLIQSGYVKVWLTPNDPFYSMVQGNGYVLEHRLVMAKALGKCLERSELVHHLNGIKHDNRIQNLIMLSSKEHHSRLVLKAVQKRLREVEEKLAQRNLFEI